MELYITDVRTLENETTYQRLYQFLHEERKTQIERYRNAPDKIRSAGVGLLLEYGLQKRGYTLLEQVPDKHLVKMTKGTYGKPYLEGVSNLYFNLSHTGDYAAVVFAKDEVGVDIERKRSANMSVARRFFTEEERLYLQEICKKHGEGEMLDRAFVRLWTRKESYIKAVGEGMHLPLTDFCVLSDCLYEGEVYYFKTWDVPDEYTLSVCTKDAIDAEITMIDLEKAFDVVK